MGVLLISESQSRRALPLYLPVETRYPSAIMAAHKKTETPSHYDEYIAAFCATTAPGRGDSSRLSKILANAVAADINQTFLARSVEAQVLVGRRTFGGAPGGHHLDACVYDVTQGLMVGIDVKGLNKPASVTRNWRNRIGDFEQLATHHHKHAPSAVIGGVLAIAAEGLDQTILSTIEDAMRKRGGRHHTLDQNDRLEVAALLVIDKEKHELLSDQSDSPSRSTCRIDTFAERIVDLFIERWS
jgi:hypothetical protein